MKKNTNKFGLLIVDDEKDMRGMYRRALSEHYKLKPVWDSIYECEEAESALKYINDYLEKSPYHLIVVSDTFMLPNCDGNKPLPEKLFGGLWLIDRVNKNEELKESVSLVLITYFDEQIKPYLMGDKVKFEWLRDKHYFYVPKPHPYTESTYRDGRAEGVDRGQKEATKELSKLDPETEERLFQETFNAILKAIDSKRGEVVGKLPLLKEETILSELPIPMIGNSEAMKKIYAIIKKIAPTDETVLITGESGTGKELVARNLHYLNPKRQNKPFIADNCSAMPDTLIEEELFGFEKGAFTGAVKLKKGRFELADEGTLFLDEMGDMRLDMQVKILRALEEREFYRVGGETKVKVDVRVIGGTNKNLQEEIKEKRFRGDLYYRLNVIPIHLPLLRERKEDIPLLVRYFLTNLYSKGYPEDLDDDAMDLLIKHSWPGNVRELENIIIRLVVLSSGDKITADDLKQWLSQESIISMVEFKGQCSSKDVEKAHLRYLLEQNNWDVDKVAEIAKVSRANVYNKIKEYGLNNK